MCGEHLSVVVLDVLAPGIIPACAGSTTRDGSRSGHRRDHPRMCGEHCLSLWLDVLAPGIIPACAGSTATRAIRCACTRDHPRMCGEHPRTPLMMPKTAGSSPHVRGALDNPVADSANEGIIPACAGSTR